MRALAAAILAIALWAQAEEVPVAPGVSAEVASEKTEFKLGEPILVDVVYRNEGKETWEVEEPHVLQFYDAFEVRDAQGKKVPNPFADVESGCYDGPVTMHKLLPGGTVTLRRYVNECAAFDKPGEYAVAARCDDLHSGCLLGPKRKDGRNDYRCPSQPLKIKVLPAPEKKERDAIASDLKRLWCAPELRDREEYARYRPYVTEDNGPTDALRLLAFRRDQNLLPLWVALLENDRAAFASEALAGLPDRAAVVKAVEEKLKGPLRDRYLWLYACLVVPKTDDVEWKDVYTRRAEIEKRFKDK